MDEILARPEACWGRVLQAVPGDKREAPGQELVSAEDPPQIQPVACSLHGHAIPGLLVGPGSRLCAPHSRPPLPPPFRVGVCLLSFSTLLSSTLFSSNYTGP